jgi:hypothetical protein
LERAGQIEIVTRQFVFSRFPAFLILFNGSPKTENIKDAIAHAESSKPLARSAT